MFAALSNMENECHSYQNVKGKGGKNKKKAKDEPIRFKHSNFPTESSLEVGVATREGGSWTVGVKGASGNVSTVKIDFLRLDADRAGKPLRFQEREVIGWCSSLAPFPQPGARKDRVASSHFRVPPLASPD